MDFPGGGGALRGTCASWKSSGVVERGDGASVAAVVVDVAAGAVVVGVVVERNKKSKKFGDFGRQVGCHLPDLPGTAPTASDKRKP